MNKLLDVLVSDAKLLEFDIQRSSIEGEGTPQEVSDRRETYIHKVIERYYPYPYRIAKGIIRDSYGKQSASIDCLIINPCHPYTIANNGLFSVILADGVDAAIEIKPDFSGSELDRGLKQLVTVKKLRRRTEQLNLNKYSEEDKEYNKTITSVIFSTSTYSDKSLLIQKIVEYYEANHIPQIEQFDMVVVNNRLLLINCKSHGHKIFPLEGIIAIDSEDKTLALFILLLNKYEGAVPRLTKSIINYYLKVEDIQDKYTTFPELNKRLVEIK